MSRRARVVTTAGVTVGIITKNRPDCVVDCVRSLSRQTVRPQRIIVIDSSDRKTFEIASRCIGMASTVPITCLHLPKAFLAGARNAALNAAVTRWIAFIDDDCIADRRWLSQLIEETARGTPAAVAGATETAFPDNCFALCARIDELMWKTPAIDNGRVVDYEILDTKNVLFSVPFIRRHRLEFDERLSARPADTNDDIDFGMQLQRAGGRAVVAAGAVVYHADARTASAYFRKIATDAVSYRSYARKWAGARKEIGRTRAPLDRNGILRAFFTRYGVPWYRRLCIRGILRLSGVVRTIVVCLPQPDRVSASLS